MRWKTVLRVSVGRDLDHRAFLVAAGDDVAQIAEVGPRQESLIDHPVVVVDLGQIAGAGVADEGDDPFGRRSARGNNAARRRPGCRSTSRRADPRRAAARAPSRSSRCPGSNRRDAPPRDRRCRGRSPRRCPRPPRIPPRRMVPVLDVVGEDRARRIGQDEFDRRIRLAEELRQTGQGAGGADTADDGVERMPALRPDLGAGRLTMGRRVIRIVELVGEEGAGDLARRDGRHSPGNSRDDPCRHPSG